MSTKKIASPAPVATTTHKLNPIVAKSKKDAGVLAAQDGRKRPVVAINEVGKLVVCCRRTAKKNGWEVQDVLYERAKPVAPIVVEEPVKSVKKASAKAKAKDTDVTNLADLLGG